MDHFLGETHKILLIETEMQVKDIAQKKQNQEMFISSETSKYCQDILQSFGRNYYQIQ